MTVRPWLRVPADLLGHRHTEAAAGQDLSGAAQAAMLTELLDALGIDAVDLVGDDGGGAIARLFAVAPPDRVRSLVLSNCDAHDNWPPRAFQSLWPRARSRVSCAPSRPKPWRSGATATATSTASAVAG